MIWIECIDIRISDIQYVEWSSVVFYFYDEVVFLIDHAGDFHITAPFSVGMFIDINQRFFRRKFYFSDFFFVESFLFCR